MATNRQRDVPFIPAYADQYCLRCGFPFREVDRGRENCHVQEACEKRRRAAQDPEGLRIEAENNGSGRPLRLLNEPAGFPGRGVSRLARDPLAVG